MSSLSKRAWAELKKLEGLSSSPVKFIIDSSPFGDEDSASSTYVFTGRILPSSEPLNQSAVRIEIKLPDKYPADPPAVRVSTPIHHPNVLESGVVCLPILTAEDSWKASYFLDDVLKELLTLIDHPDLNMPVNEAVANEYLHNKSEYDRRVLEMVRKNPVSRT